LKVGLGYYVKSYLPKILLNNTWIIIGQPHRQAWGQGRGKRSKIVVLCAKMPETDALVQVWKLPRESSVGNPEVANLKFRVSNQQLT
jgi:hypothetical protein